MRYATQYCRHGVFVGGSCGPDYMCGQCESGDPDPTPRDYLTWAAEDAQFLEEREAELEFILLSAGTIITPELGELCLRGAAVAWRNNVRSYHYSLPWAKHLDDDRWLVNYYYESLREADEDDAR